MEQVAKKENAKVAEAKSQVQANGNVAAKDAAKEAEFKAKKAAAAKAFNERQAALKAHRAEAVKALKEFATKNNLKYPEVIQKWIDEESAVRTSNGGGSSFFNKVFGDSPKVGDKITLIDYMKKTLKAKADLDKYCKQWAEKGIVVEFKEAANLFESVYTIVKLA